MLSTRLREVLEKLKKKGYAARTSVEDELLAELETLDGDTQTRAVFESMRKSAADRMGSPSDKCSCCGK